MLKAKATLGDGSSLIIFGLSDRNLELLREGRPIQFDGQKLGINGQVVILYGRTEADIVKDIQENMGMAVPAGTT